MIVYYIGGPADLVKQRLDLPTIPPCLYYTSPVMIGRSVSGKRSRYELVSIRRDENGDRIGIYEYDALYTGEVA